MYISYLVVAIFAAIGLPAIAWATNTLFANELGNARVDPEDYKKDSKKEVKI